jgi:hypothetical protein
VTPAPIPPAATKITESRIHSKTDWPSVGGASSSGMGGKRGKERVATRRGEK